MGHGGDQSYSGVGGGHWVRCINLTCHAFLNRYLYSNVTFGICSKTMFLKNNVCIYSAEFPERLMLPMQFAD